MQHKTQVHHELCVLADTLDVFDKESKVMLVELQNRTGTRSDKSTLRHMSLRVKALFESLQQYEDNLLVQRLSLHGDEDLNQKIDELLQSTRLLRESVSCIVDETDFLIRDIEADERQDTLSELAEFCDQLSRLTTEFEKQQGLSYEIQKDDIPAYNTVLSHVLEIEKKFCECRIFGRTLQAKICHDDDNADFRDYSEHIDSVLVKIRDFMQTLKTTSGASVNLGDFCSNHDINIAI